jgi:hypothetical protein
MSNFVFNMQLNSLKTNILIPFLIIETFFFGFHQLYKHVKSTHNIPLYSKLRHTSFFKTINYEEIYIYVIYGHLKTMSNFYSLYIIV